MKSYSLIDQHNEQRYVSRSQRRFYTIFVGIAILLGSALGLVSWDTPHVPLFIGIGGYCFGALISGGILVGRYIKNHKRYAVIGYILLPLTLSIMWIIGVFTLIPYFICNLLALLQTKKIDDPQRLELLTLQVNRITSVFVVLFILVATIGGNLWNYFSDRQLSKEIAAITGFPEGSPDHFILRQFYGNAYKDVYFKRNDYKYVIKKDVLFILAENVPFINSISTKIVYPNSNGYYVYSKDFVYKRYKSLSGRYMRSDINELFTGIEIVENNNVFAYMLTIDEKNNLDDKTYVNPNEIHLANDEREPISSLISNDGKYIIFFDTMSTSDPSYKVIASYSGKEVVLLSSDDIRNLRISSED